MTENQQKYRKNTIYELDPKKHLDNTPPKKQLDTQCFLSTQHIYQDRPYYGS